MSWGFFIFCRIVSVLDYLDKNLDGRLSGHSVEKVVKGDLEEKYAY